MGKKRSKPFHAVARGHVVGVFSGYDAARVDGASNSLHRSFDTREAAQAFVDQHRELPRRSTGLPTADGSSPADEEQLARHQPRSRVELAVAGLADVADVTTYATVENVQAHTDGSCNGVVAGFGFVLTFANGPQREFHGATPADLEQTNNVGELIACVEALRVAEEIDRATLERKRPPFTLIVRCDSQYVVDGIEKWIMTWIANGWKTAKGDAVLHRALWEELMALRKLREAHRRRFIETHSSFEVRTDLNPTSFAAVDEFVSNATQFRKVAAHAGHALNELADSLAKRGVLQGMALRDAEKRMFED